MENDQESELDMLMSNELPEGEKQIKISSYFLFVSCQSMMKITETQRKKFIGLCEYLATQRDYHGGPLLYFPYDHLSF